MLHTDAPYLHSQRLTFERPEAEIKQQADAYQQQPQQDVAVQHTAVGLLLDLLRAADEYAYTQVSKGGDHPDGDQQKQVVAYRGQTPDQARGGEVADRLQLLGLHDCSRKQLLPLNAE